MGWIVHVCIFLGGSFFVHPSANGAELEGIKMEDAISVDNHRLVINGLALRKVYKFGIPVKVYVAGLYLEAINSDPEEILKSKKMKHLEMEFVRNVDKDQIVEAWSGAVFSGCIADCEKNKGPLKEFNSLMGEMRKGQRMTIDFYPDHISVSQNGRYPKSGSVMSATFARNLLAIFIGPKMFSAEVKAALLGQQVK